MKSKAQILKLASNLEAFTTKIKQAQEGLPGLGNGMGETLTPEAVKDVAEEIQQVAEVAAELAAEIAEGVPAEESTDVLPEREEKVETKQIEVAQDDEDKDDEKKKLNEQVASMQNELAQIKRAGMLEKLATKYASFFPKSMHEGKMNEILTAKDDLAVIQARVQEASNIITNKTMVKIASQTDSIYDFETSDGAEINISSKL